LAETVIETRYSVDDGLSFDYRKGAGSGGGRLQMVQMGGIRRKQFPEVSAVGSHVKQYVNQQRRNTLPDVQS